MCFFIKLFINFPQFVRFSFANFGRTRKFTRVEIYNILTLKTSLQERTFERLNSLTCVCRDIRRSKEEILFFTSRAVYVVWDTVTIIIHFCEDPYLL